MSIISNVTKYLQDHENEYCHVADISNALGYTFAQIRTSINTKRYEDENYRDRVKIVHRGATWRYVAQHSNEPRNKTEIHTVDVDTIHKPSIKHNTYEQIGKTISGDLILQDENGNLYRATELT